MSAGGVYHEPRRGARRCSPPIVDPTHFQRRVTAVPSGYIEFDRAEWAALLATPLTLAEADLEQLRGINDQIDLEEVAAVYLPLSRLLNLYVSAVQDLHRVSATFLGAYAPKVPTSLE